MEQNFNPKLEQLRQSYLCLPFGAARAAANQKAVQKADEAANPYYRISMRDDLAWSFAVGDDPAKALPVCAEYFAILDQYPNILPDTEIHTIIKMEVVAAVIAQLLPQIPLEQCKAFLDQLETLVQRYGMGQQNLSMQLCNFYLMCGDKQQAELYFERARLLPRDAVSDCETCDCCNMAGFLLAFGRRQEAEEMARPVLKGIMTCQEQPQEILCDFLADDILHENWEIAGKEATRLYHIAHRNKSDLKFIGLAMQCWAFTDLSRAFMLLDRHLQWIVGVWDQQLLFSFYTGAWLVCSHMAQKQTVLPFGNIPSKKLPFFRQDGVYEATTVAKWFYENAYKIGIAFDCRNGTAKHAEILNHRLLLEQGGVIL